MYKQLLSKISFALMIAVLVLAVLPIIPARAATNTASSSGFWNDTNTWGGASVPNSSDDVIINSGITVTIPAGYPAACNTINFTTGTTGPASIVLAESTSLLKVNGAVKIQEQASGGFGNRINVGAGTFSAKSIDLLATTNASRYSEILISTGTATISGNITSSGMASRTVFSNSGIINVGGTFLSGVAGTFTPSTGTVNFNAGGAQTVGAYTYYNLMLSGSGSKSLPADTSVNGNLSIAGSATASVAANQNITVGTLKLGGLGTDNGTWGSLGSSATYQADNFFNSTTGYLTVTTDTRTPREKLEVTGPDSLTYGTTGTITHTGGSVNEAISYSHGLSSGCKVDSSGVITVTNVSGTCAVTATRAENGNYLATESDGFGVTLNPLAVTLSGSRAYDTTDQAAAGILLITNKIVTDDVIIAQGSARLADTNVGTQSITSMGTLALYGASATNYTLSEATGSVNITKADQAPLTVTGPNSLKYGSTGTITYRGGSGTGAISYSHGSSSGCKVDSSSGVITVTNVSGTCTVTATRAEDGNYLATKSAEVKVTLNPLAVTLSGIRPYDTTASAAAGSLSISNKVGGDNININPLSGSVGLSSPNVGTQSITSMGSLALNGTSAINYTFSGASGLVKITKADQRIKFDQPANTATYNSIFTVLPTADSGLAVTVTASGACSISGSNVTMNSGTGTCTLTASQAGDANYKTVTNVKTVTAQKANQKITFPEPASPATYGSTFKVSPPADSGLTVTVTVGGACSISGSNVTMTSGEGTCTLTASQAGDNKNYNSAPNVVKTVTSQKANQTITFNQPASPVTYGSTFTVSPTSSSGLVVTVTASGGCTISGNTVSMTSGTAPCTLTASQAADANYNGTSVQQTVTAQKANQSITFAIPVSRATYNTLFTVAPTSSSGLAVHVSASGGCILWYGGIVTMESGTYSCTLTASQAGDANYNPVNVVRTVTAQKANQKITFPEPASPATYGSTFTVSPTADSGLAVKVASSGVCSISGSNVTMTSGTGTCTLTASQAGDNKNYNSAPTVEKTVTAQKANQIITFNQPASPAIYLKKFTVYPTSSSGLAVTVTPSGLGCILWWGGTVFMTSGTNPCTLTASQAGDYNYYSAPNVAKTVNAQKANQTITFNQPASPATYGSTFTVSPTSSPGLAVTVTAGGACSISGSNVTMTSGTGPCTLTASQAGDYNYYSAPKVAKTVNAQKANQTITFNQPASPATYNSKFTVYPTSSSGLAVTVKVGGVCTISGNTVTMTSGEGTCTLTASQAGNNNYNPAINMVRTVTAQKANQSITFPAPASPAMYNTSFKVAPTADSRLTVTVTANGGCTISGNDVTMTSGTVSCTLTASQAGDANYNSVTNVKQTVTAQKADQEILKVTGPSSLTQGTSGQIIYNGGFGSGRVLFNHGSSTGCKVDSFGVITVTNVSGSCTVWVTKESDNNYLATTSAGFEISLK